MEKVEECVQNWLEFKEDQFEDKEELLFAMEEIDRRRKELKITENEWFSVWMLGRVKKRKRMETSQYQALRNVVKEGGEDIMKNFGIRYRELKVEGTRKAGLWIRIFFVDLDPDPAGSKYMDPDSDPAPLKIDQNDNILF